MTKLTSWRAFLALWGGQTASLVGSALFAFAIGVWIYQRTGSATMFGLALFFDMMPGILAAPYAGVVADRVNRRTLMILGDTGCAISSLAIVAIAWTDPSPDQLWWVFLPLALGGVSAAFHGAAFEASFVLLVEENKLGRANGLFQISYGMAELLGPLLGGFLIVMTDLWVVLLVDTITFVVSLAVLSIIKIPDVRAASEEDEAGGPLGPQLAYGWRYIRRRPALLILLAVFSALNFAANLAAVGITPLVLAFADPRALGTVMMLGGAGLIAGGLVMGTWGGPKRKVSGVLGGTAIAGVFAIIYGIQPHTALVAAASFGFFFCLPVINTCSATIWQSRVEPAVQGRVFAVRRVVAQASVPLAFLAGGWLIDRVFDGLLVGNGGFTDVLGSVFDTGPGRGIGVMFALVGVGLIGLALIGRTSRSMRSLDDSVPTASSATTSSAASSATPAASSVDRSEGEPTTATST